MRRGLGILCLVGALLLLLNGSQAQARMLFFQTPSGNIGCAMGADAVRCDIRHHSWSPPPKPTNCYLDWGYGLTVRNSGLGHFFCGGDSVFGDAGILPYGSIANHGHFRCWVRVKGVRCVNKGTRHGFFLSRERANPF